MVIIWCSKNFIVNGKNLSSVQSDGRDAQGRDEDGGGLKQSRHRTSHRVVAELEYNKKEYNNIIENNKRNSSRSVIFNSFGVS